MDKNDFDAILQKYLRGEATEEEENMVEKWYSSIESTEPPSGIFENRRLKSRVWEKVRSHTLKGAPFYKTRPFVKVSWALSMAAAISMAIVFYVFVLTADDPHPDNFFAETKHLQAISNTGITDTTLYLTDGSRVSLKPGSTLHLADSFNITKREVFLTKGEGFFEIEKDPARPFYVYTQKVVTKVLGTSFTVNANKPDVVVAVRTGVVSVFSREHSLDIRPDQRPEVILTPNQQAVYDSRQGTMSRSLVKEPVVVLSEEDLNDMHFESASVPAILDALSKAYGVPIEYDDRQLASCSLTTFIDKSEDIYKRLDIICDAIGATYQVEGVIIRITSNGCH